MSGGFIPALCALQCKRHIHIGYQLGIDAAVKIIQITGPTSIQGQPVLPSQLGLGLGTVLKVEHVMRQNLMNARLPAKHQQTSQRQALYARTAISPPGTNLAQKFRVIHGDPRMGRVTACKGLPVGMKALEAQIVPAEVRQNPFIAAVFHLLGQHSAHFLVAHAAVAIV